MNKDILKGKWKQLKGDIKREWGKLTDDDMDRIAGDHDKLVGRLQELYGLKKEEAEKKIDAMVDEKTSASS
ncbi:MAG: CsbD family protein [Planctomycetota bacterium]